MLNKIFPRTIDNTLNGQWLGFWLLVPLLAMKLMIAFGSMVFPGKANSTDGIDISGYSTIALQEAVASTALLGLLHLSIGLFCVLAMIRYRALIPLLYIWLLFEFLGRRLLLNIYPIERTGDTSSATIINLVFFALMVIGFALSMWPRNIQRV